MRIEKTFVTISLVCFFFSIYFAVLSLNVIVDQLSKERLLATATSFFVGGAVIAILLIASKIIGRLLSKTKEAKPGTHIPKFSFVEFHLGLLMFRPQL